jgi:putative methyltransferase (TIGR04325 family)
MTKQQLIESVSKGAALYAPPVLVRTAKYLLSEWEYRPDGWSVGEMGTEGWNDSSIADAQAQHWPELIRNLQGYGPLGVSHFPWKKTREDWTDHNAMMSLGYVLALASRKKDQLSILDWGGGVGHHYPYSRALIPEVEIDYHCYDLPRLCSLGKTFLPDASFYTRESEALARCYDLILCGSSLHYFEDWRGILGKLAAKTELLYVSRSQTVHSAPSFVVVQKPHRVGYRTQYRCWFLNRQELILCAENAGLELIREFLYSEQWYVRGAPEQGHCRGFLFRRTNRTAAKEES